MPRAARASAGTLAVYLLKSHDVTLASSSQPHWQVRLNSQRPKDNGMRESTEAATTLLEQVYAPHPRDRQKLQTTRQALHRDKRCRHWHRTQGDPHDGSCIR